MTKNELLKKLEGLKNSEDNALRKAVLESFVIAKEGIEKQKNTIFLFVSVLKKLKPHQEKIEDFYSEVEAKFLSFFPVRQEDTEDKVEKIKYIIDFLANIEKDTAKDMLDLVNESKNKIKNDIIDFFTSCTITGSELFKTYCQDPIRNLSKMEEEENSINDTWLEQSIGEYEFNYLFEEPIISKKVISKDSKFYKKNNYQKEKNNQFKIQEDTIDNEGVEIYSDCIEKFQNQLKKMENLFPDDLENKAYRELKSIFENYIAILESIQSIFKLSSAFDEMPIFYPGKVQKLLNTSDMKSFKDKNDLFSNHKNAKNLFKQKKFCNALIEHIEKKQIPEKGLEIINRYNNTLTEHQKTGILSILFQGVSNFFTWPFKLFNQPKKEELRKDQVTKFFVGMKNGTD